MVRLFRAARKALLDQDEEPPAADKKRGGETGGAFLVAARKLFPRSLARRAFRLARDILSWSGPAVADAAFLPEAFGPPDPCNPFDSTWQQPFIEHHADFAGNFEDAMPPPNGPSANP
jgi:hypothetical protein